MGTETADKAFAMSLASSGSPRSVRSPQSASTSAWFDTWLNRL